MLLLPHHLRTHSCWWCFSVEPVVVVVNGTNMMTVAIGGGASSLPLARASLFEWLR